MPDILEDRIAALELEVKRVRTANRRLGGIGLVLVAATMAVAWVPQAQENIKAKSISLVDSKGVERVKLYAGDDAAGLVLYERAHKPTASLDSFGNGPALCLFDSAGKRRVRAAVSRDNPSLEFLRPNEQSYFRIP